MQKTLNNACRTIQKHRNHQVKKVLNSLLDDGTVKIAAYSGTDTALVLPTKLDGKKVTGIGNRAFEYNETITSITIPEGIEFVGNNAFWCCKNVTELSLPDTLVSIGDNGFSHCEKIQSVEIPDSVTELGEFAFQSCSAATTLKIPENLSEIPDFSFSGFENITELNIPSNVKVIGANAFAHCSGLTDVEIPEGVEMIGGSAFSYCTSLSKVTLPTSLRTIEGFAFSSCTSLMEVTVPPTVTEIERMALGYWFNKDVWNDIPLEGFVLKGYTYSAAEAYANEYGITFESIGEAEVFQTKLNVSQNSDMSITAKAEVKHGTKPYTYKFFVNDTEVKSEGDSYT